MITKYWICIRKSKDSRMVEIHEIDTYFHGEMYIRIETSRFAKKKTKVK